jgi:opacity protein-like surface antigen
MLRRLVSALPFVIVALAPAVSSAASDADCPDGWFCEPGPARPPGAPSDPLSPGPGAPAPEPGPGPSRASGNSPAGQPAPDDYPVPPPPPDGPEAAFEVPPDNPPPKRRRRRGFREWGLNLHLEGALFRHAPEHAPDRWMGGLGFGFRYRPIPWLAFEAGIDVLKRSDHQRYSRTEVALLLNTLVFFNPRDVVQVYALGGLGFSGANVTLGARSGDSYYKLREEHYAYFGGQLGLGVEVRVSRRVAIAGDLLGFVRGRSDERWDDAPEYIDGDIQRTGNSSGGLLRAGVTLYW